MSFFKILVIMHGEILFNAMKNYVTSLTMQIIGVAKYLDQNSKTNEEG